MIHFTLLAPTITQVELLGEWTDQVFPMHLVDDQWMVEVEVPDGQWWYKFRLRSRSPFLHDQMVEVADPLARMVVNEQSVLMVEQGQDVTTSYVWQFDDVTLPGNRALAIYEAHVAEFGATGTRWGKFADVEARLDYLQQLGINALELMPVMWFPEDLDWGYNVRFSCAVNDRYGTPQELKHLIDACHQREIRVILDVVVNHHELYSPLAQIDFYYWFKDDLPGEVAYGPKFNYELMDEQGLMPATIYMLTMAKYWLQEYRIDGFRIDSAALVNNNDFLQRIYDHCHELVVDKPLYMVVEYLPEDPSVVSADGPADGAWHQRIEFELMTALTTAGSNSSELFRSLLASHSGYALPMQVVNYVESHDEGRLVERLVSSGLDTERVHKASLLSMVILATAVGNPMIFAGQEFGAANKNTKKVRALDWSLLETKKGHDLHQAYGRLLRWCLSLPALAEDVIRSITVEPGLLIYRRGRPDQALVVAINFSDQDQLVDFKLAKGKWRELWGGEEFESTGRVEVLLPKLGSKLFLRMAEDER